MPYAVTLSPHAQRQLHTFDKQLPDRLLLRIGKLKDEPRPSGTKKLTGEEKAYRIRVGDYRILYDVDDQTRTVVINKIGHRRDVYRHR